MNFIKVKLKIDSQRNRETVINADRIISAYALGDGNMTMLVTLDDTEGPVTVLESFREVQAKLGIKVDRFVQ